jgi:signal transduction histidine kinase
LAINRHENLTGTTVEARIGTLPQQVSGALKICVYRIIQESLTNSFRHAGGIGQLVLVNQEAGTIQITVSDKGKGFTTTVRKQESLGLRGIHNRTLAFGGHVVIESAEQTGTTVVVTLPLNKPG